MTQPFNKLLAELTVADIQKLLGQPESETLEVKSTLSRAKGAKEDPWLDPEPTNVRQGPSDSAKGEIFESVIALANNEGGLGYPRPRRDICITPCH